MTPKDPPVATGTPVVVRDLIVDRGPVRAVDGLNFTVESGTITALLGPNGAGKTSTVEHLEGYLPRTSGEVCVLGLDPAGNRRELSRSVGLMLQNGGIQTAVRPSEVLTQYASFFADPESPRELLEWVGLTERAGTPYRRLSGGEQQRLSLALAMVGRPRLLFLDEPTAGVDLSGRDLIRSLVRAQGEQGRTVLLTTHDLAEAEQLADQVIIIDHGRLLAKGSPAELMASVTGEDLRFGASPGLDAATLGTELGVAVTEASPGEYVVAANPTPELVAAVTAWLARHGAPLSDLRAGRQSLEDVFRRLTTDNHPPIDTEPSYTARSEGIDPEGQLRGGSRRASRRYRRRRTPAEQEPADRDGR